MKRTNHEGLASAAELESLRRFDSKDLAQRARVDQRTAQRAKAGERVHPLMLRALLDAANTLASESTAA